MKQAPRAQNLPETISQNNESAGDLQDQIRIRAYELHEQRGKQDGYDVEDWLQAEEEVTGRLKITIAA
jgi:hypothetical protein